MESDGNYGEYILTHNNESNGVTIDGDYSTLLHSVSYSNSSCGYSYGQKGHHNYLKDANAYKNNQYGVYMKSFTHDLKLIDINAYQNNYSGIRITGEAYNVVVEKCELHANKDDGLLISRDGDSRTENNDIHDIKARYNVIYDNTQDGLEVSDIRNVKLYNNTVVKDNLYVGGTISNLTIDNSLIQTINNSSYLASDNILGPSSSLFVDYSENNFRLSSAATSAIDKGSVVEEVASDFDGNPIDDLPDIGAFEYIGDQVINHAPEINDQRFVINDTYEEGILIGKVTASDYDDDNLTFSITSGNTENQFSIETTSGNITLADNSVLTNYNDIVLLVKVADDGDPSKSGSAAVTISIKHERPPEPPTAVVASSSFYSSVHLAWNDNSNNDLGVVVERSDSPSGGYNMIDTVRGMEEYTDIDLEETKTYYYRVYAYNEYGSSVYSTVVSATTPSHDEALLTVGNIILYPEISTTNNLRAQPTIMPEDGELNSISIYHMGGAGDLILGVYEDNNGTPGDLIAVTSQVQVNAEEGWQKVDLVSSISVNQGEQIWLAWVFESIPGIRFTPGDPGRANASTGWSSGMPDNFGSSSVSSYVYSIYASYTVESSDVVIEPDPDPEPNPDPNPDPTVPPQNNPPVIIAKNFEFYYDKDVSEQIGYVEAEDPDNDKLSYTLMNNNDDIFKINEEGLLGFNNTELLDPINNPYLSVMVKVSDEDGLTATASMNITLIPMFDVVYIDPEVNDNSFMDGSKEFPYNSWKDVNWTDGAYYLQKSNTQAVEDKILVTANDVTIGIYGSGSSAKIISNATDYAVKAIDKQNVNIKNLQIEAEDAIACIYFLGENSLNNSIEECKLLFAEYGIRMVEGSGYRIKYNTFQVRIDGIYSLAEDMEIYYNIFKENMTAINVASYNTDVLVYNNVFYGNDQAVSSSYSSLTLYNNIFYLLDEGDVAINQALDEINSDNNIFYPEQNGFIKIGNHSFSRLSTVQSQYNIDINSMAKDPLFMDIYKDNFSTSEESPAIDAGRFLGILHDILGYKVPVGNAPDIGATENTTEKVTSVGKYEEHSNSLFDVYPNPSRGIVNISFDNNDLEDYQLEIKDATGKNVYYGEVNSNEINFGKSIDLSSQDDGLYYIQLKSKSKTYTGKIVKM